MLFGGTSSSVCGLDSRADIRLLVVYHHGTSASGGHYTVAVSRQDTAGWIHFDDETYAPVSSASVVVSREEAEEGRTGLINGREKCAYLLFYQRIRA